MHRRLQPTLCESAKQNRPAVLLFDMGLLKGQLCPVENVSPDSNACIPDDIQTKLNNIVFSGSLMKLEIHAASVTKALVSCVGNIIAASVETWCAMIAQRHGLRGK